MGGLLAQRKGAIAAPPDRGDRSDEEEALT
jgi:hypothetical protein